MLFNLFTKKDINKGVEDWKKTDGAILLDVRTKEEYQNYHIEGSLNIPLQSLDSVENQIPDKNTPIFVHCLSGARSASAASILQKKGYTTITDIGGISSYKGQTL